MKKPQSQDLKQSPPFNHGVTYLDGDGQDLVLKVLVEQTEGSSDELQRAGIRAVGFDALQHLVVNDVNVTRLW